MSFSHSQWLSAIAIIQGAEGKKKDQKPFEVTLGPPILIHAEPQGQEPWNERRGIQNIVNANQDPRKAKLDSIVCYKDKGMWLSMDSSWTILGFGFKNCWWRDGKEKKVMASEQEKNCNDFFLMVSLINGITFPNLEDY